MSPRIPARTLAEPLIRLPAEPLDAPRAEQPIGAAEQGPRIDDRRPTGGTTSRRGDLELASAHLRARAGRRPERFQVGTYNVGNANHIAGRPENFARTKAFLGEKAAKGEVDVLMLQEVDRGTRRAQGHDNNVEMLKAVFQGELGTKWKDARLRTRQIDGNTTEVVARNDDGEVRRMRIDQRHYDDKGERTHARPSPITRYEATIVGKNGDEDRTYNLVYGASRPVRGQGQYGNAILTGPGFTPQRFALRAVGRDPSDDERRTALAVEVETPHGRELGVVATHLTNARDPASVRERADQYRTLDRFADRYFDHQPHIVGGDFNSRAARPRALGWTDPDPHKGGIDRIYTEGGRVSAGRRHVYVDRGGSDHDMARWNVKLR